MKDIFSPDHSRFVKIYWLPQSCTHNIDPEAPTEERIRAWIEQLNNPYVYLDGGMIVKLSFADRGETIKERINSLYLAGV